MAKIKTCAVCGKEFETQPHGTTRRTCSEECRRKLLSIQAKEKRRERLEKLKGKPYGPRFLTVAECHLCRSCKWAGKANGGAATVSCDYAFRTGELRGCEVSEHCARYEAKGRRGKE